MATDRALVRVRERLERLQTSSLDCDSLRYEAAQELRPLIGFHRWSWPLADPDSLIPLSGLAEHDYGPSVPRVLELEYGGEDLGGMRAVARRKTPAASLDAETCGDLARSLRWDEVLRHVGIGDEIIVAFRDRYGCWGWLKAYRDAGERPFDERDVDFLSVLSPILGTALRRSVANADAVAPPETGTVPGTVPDRSGAVATVSAPCVILLDSNLRPTGGRRRRASGRTLYLRRGSTRRSGCCLRWCIRWRRSRDLAPPQDEPRRSSEASMEDG